MIRPARHRRRAVRMSLAGLAAGALLLSGCASTPKTDDDAGSDDGTPRTGGNVTVQIPEDPAGLDLIAHSNISAGYIAEHVIGSLFDIDADHEPQPTLVADTKVSDDGTEYTFTLRQGVVFSDGTPLTTKDVIASLKYWMEYGSSGGKVGDVLKSMSAKDDLTFTMTLKHRYPLLIMLTGAQIVKAKAAESAGATGFTREQSIGTGPYKVESWKPGQKIVLERNDEYQAPEGEASGNAGARHAYLDEITFQVVGDADAIANGLKTGQWDAAMPSVEYYKRLKNDPDLTVATVDDTETNWIFLNHNKESLFTKQKARDALNLALDKPAINAAAGGSPDLTTAISSYSSKENTKMYSSAGEDEYKAHDPKKAKKLFAEAGYHGQTLTILTTSEYSQFVTEAELIQAQLKKIGVKAQVKSYDYGTMVSMLDKPGSWDMMPLMGGSNDNTPANNLAVVGLLGKQGWTSPARDAALKAYMSAPDDETRRKAADRIQQIIWDEKPVIVLSQTKQYVAYSPRLKGYDHFGLDFWNTWVEG